MSLGIWWEKMLFFCESNFYHFPTISRNVSASSFLFCMVVKIHFSFSRGIYWARTVFRKKRVPFSFGHGRKRFQHCVKNIPGEVISQTLHVHKKVSRENRFYWKHFFCHLCRTMIENFSVFVGNSSIGLSILYTTRQ